MRYVLGLDIGSNSVGSAAWVVDTHEVVTGVSVFPAGVELSDRGRGDPVGRDRRMKRTLRRMIARRAQRKREVWMACAEAGLLPLARAEIDALLQDDSNNPWRLRAVGLVEPLSPYQFGRVLLHLAQRRGGLGLSLPDTVEETKERQLPDSKDVTTSRAAFDHTRLEMDRRGAGTYGELIWTLMQERRRVTETGTAYALPVRNRDNLMVEQPERAFFAKREMIREEFHRLWDVQRSYGGQLGAILTDDLRLRFDDPSEDADWRHKGILFGQRRTKWDLGVLGRCTLEPTDRCVPHADMHAQRYRVLDVITQLAICTSTTERPLTAEERDRVVDYLSTPQFHTKGVHRGKPIQGVKPKHLRLVLGLPNDDTVWLNLEKRDPDRTIHPDWFSRSFIHGVFGTDRWNAMDQSVHEAVNRAVLKFDPENERHEERLRKGCAEWWGLSSESTEAFLAAWRSRPKLEMRLKLSRRAILNTMPYMQQQRRDGGWPTHIEARRAFAEDDTACDAVTGRPAKDDQRRRYFFGIKGLTSRDRHFLAKHPDMLPPAPSFSNPVVRKAIHEVRRHIVAYIRRFGCKPERVVLEFSRDATQTGKQREEVLSRNRWRDTQRQKIGEEVVAPTWRGELHRLSTNQRRAAVDRVVLSRQQQHTCPYCGSTALTEMRAALGQDCEIDHIQPYSATGDNSLANKVLCCTGCNQEKKKRSPRQWWGDRFGERSHVARRLFADHEWLKGDYFTRRDYDRKWHNFTRESPAPEAGGFGPGQMEATAYAARAVKSYLADALYGGTGSSEHGGDRRIFVTHGKYTAMLRRDWQLFQTLRQDGREGESDGKEETQAAGQKNRADHRHHAIDAIVIALTTPDMLAQLGYLAKQAEVYFVEHNGRHMRRDPLPPPFGSDVAEFRRIVLSRVFSSFDRAAKTGIKADGEERGEPLLVAHRPVKRRLLGHLHKETLYGPVLVWNPESCEWERDPSKATARIAIAALKPSHLRVPEGWDERSARVRDGRTPRATKAVIKRELAAMDDPSPGKSGLVRDRALRDRLRRSLRDIGLDPDSFTEKQMKAALDKGKMVTLDSGKPVRAVVLLRTNNDPVVIPRKRWNIAARQLERDPDIRTVRIYDSQNNHHIEIREDGDGRWSGVVVTAFTAAGRVRMEGRQAVDRSDDDARGGRFIMSLAEGETVHMQHPKKNYADYFVVYKIDKPQTVHLIHHWDARGASEKKGPDGNPIPGTKREEISATVSNLRRMGPEGDGGPPYKVRVTPLGMPFRMVID